jgi:hypothetical protein
MVTSYKAGRIDSFALVTGTSSAPHCGHLSFFPASSGLLRNFFLQPGHSKDKTGAGALGWDCWRGTTAGGGYVKD